MSDIEARMATALAARDWKQADLVAASGITSGGVSNWCRGVVQAEHAKADTLIRLSSALGVRPEWLVYGRGAMQDRTGPAQAVRLDADKLAESFIVLRDAFALKGRAFDVAAHADLLALVYEHLVNPDEEEAGGVLAVLGIARGPK